MKYMDSVRMASIFPFCGKVFLAGFAIQNRECGGVHGSHCK